MSVRYAPFATVKMLSIATIFRSNVEGGNTDPLSAFADAVRTMINSTTPDLQIDAFKRYYDDSTLFRQVALADNINITESYGTRPVYGIGGPTDPLMVPNNMSVSVTISRLTTDNLSIADYALKPAYYYDATMQGLAVNSAISLNGSALHADRAFHVYLAVSDIEHGGSLRDIDNHDLLNNYELIEFMPVSYTRRINGDNSIIMTDVEGTGKILRLKDVLSTLVSQLN